MLISEAFNLYRDEVIVFKNQSKKTEENHGVALRSLVGYLGDLEVTSLGFEHVRQWKLHLDKGRSPETVRNYIIKLRVVLDYLQRKEVACLSPELVPVPQRSDKVPIFVSKEDVAKLISCTNKIKNKCIISFLYASGVRVSELCSLNRDQLRDNCFTVVGKGGRARLCFIDDRTRYLLDEYLFNRVDNAPALFLTEAGKRLTPKTIQETFKSVRKRSGLDVHPHTMRHSFATNLLQTNTNLYHVSKMLGHRQLNTTQAYLHVVDPDLEKIYREHHTI